MEGKKIMIVIVPEGTDKPYKDKDAVIFLKNGANRRKVTSNEENFKAVKQRKESFSRRTSGETSHNGRSKQREVR